VGRKPACAVGSDLPSGTAPPADSTAPLTVLELKSELVQEVPGLSVTLPADQPRPLPWSRVVHGAELAPWTFPLDFTDVTK
jgi:hypothetical protein